MTTEEANLGTRAFGEMLDAARRSEQEEQP